MSEQVTPAEEAFEDVFAEMTGTSPKPKEEEEVVSVVPVVEPEPVEEPVEVVEEVVDYEALYKAEEQKRKTIEGRFAKYRDEQKEKENDTPEPIAPVHDGHAEFWEEYSILREPLLALVKDVVDQKINSLDIDSLKSSVKDVSEEAHFNAIAVAHPDFREVVVSPEFNRWMNSLPYVTEDDSMDASTAQRYFNTGTPDEVILLLSAFKNTGTASKSKSAPAEKENLTQRVVHAVAVESGGGSLPSTSVKSPSSESFEDAFAEFAAKKK